MNVKLKQGLGVLRNVKPWVVNICRLLLSLTFLFSGFVKANDPLGTAIKLVDYQAAMGVEPADGLLTLGASIALSAFEFSLGVALLFGLNRRVTAHLTTLFMLVMTALTVWLYATDAVTDCGCFGDAFILTNGQTLLKNIVLLAACVPLVLWSRMQKRLVSEQNSWMVSFPLMVGIVGYAVVCIYRLPCIDFRPYHVGADLVAMRERPSFSSTYTYKIHELDVMDFYMLDAETDEDVADDYLMAEGYKLMLVAPDLSVADQGCVGDINLIYDYAHRARIPFCCVTASDTKAQAFWVDHTGAEYDFYQSDERTLKTMVRANPGLVLFKDGVVVHKWSNWNMPDEEALEQLTMGDS